MQDTKRWSIRGVPVDVVDGFRRMAFEAGCPIAELVEEAFEVWWAECVDDEDDDGDFDSASAGPDAR